MLLIYFTQFRLSFDTVSDIELRSQGMLQTLILLYLQLPIINPKLPNSTLFLIFPNKYLIFSSKLHPSLHKTLYLFQPFRSRLVLDWKIVGLWQFLLDIAHLSYLFIAVCLENFSDLLVLYQHWIEYRYRMSIIQLLYII